MSDEANCTGCPLHSQDRRAFLRTGALAAVAITGLPGLLRALETGVLRVSDTKASAARGSTRSYPIPTADGVQIDHDNDVILVRWTGAMYAFDLSCPHQNTALRWDDTAKHFRCPKHHSEYQADGTYISGRATRSMDRFAISRDGSNVVVDVDTEFQQDKDAAGWSAAMLHLEANA